MTLAAEPKRAVESFAGLSVEECGCTPRGDGSMSATGTCRAERLSRRIERRSRVCVPRWCARRGTGEWWRADVWEPRRDPRIPVREHEPLGEREAPLRRDRAAVAAGGDQVVFACALERGMLAWTSLPGYRTYLGGYFSEFLLEAGIDDPRLAPSETELRGVALASLSYLRGRRSGRGGRPLSLVSVGLSQSAVASFYLFMADQRHEAAKALGEPRWSS